MQFGFLAQKLFNQPLALSKGKAEILAHLLRAGQNDVAILGQDQPDRERRRYSVTAGVAVISVSGILLNESGYCWWGAAYYCDIRMALAAAIGDPEVRAAVLLIDSPGGTVVGCFDLVDAIYAMRGIKPIWAVLNEVAFSAAYALASACDKVVVPRTGGVGSIGVLVMHVDISAMLATAGIKITPIYFGDRKIDGTETAPLADPVLERIQTDVDTIGGLFVETVARNRGMSASAVKATQAGTFLGGAGVAAGLADDVASPDEAFLALLNTIG